MNTLDDQTRTELEAAAWRKLVGHLQKRSDVQNIDLMNLAGFCRNCMWKWYLGAAEQTGVEMSKDQAQQAIYGISYGDWKQRYQSEASAEQIEQFNSLTSDQITE